MVTEQTKRVMSAFLRREEGLSDIHNRTAPPTIIQGATSGKINEHL
jgi:hypothetical protein